MTLIESRMPTGTLTLVLAPILTVALTLLSTVTLILLATLDSACACVVTGGGGYVMSFRLEATLDSAWQEFLLPVRR